MVRSFCSVVLLWGMQMSLIAASPARAREGGLFDGPSLPIDPNIPPIRR